MDFRYLKIEKSPSPELIEILNKNIIGTPGYGMLYQHLGVAEKINRIANPYFVNLVRANRITGTCCFCSRATINAGNPIQSFYVRYFSFLDAFRRKTIKEKVRNTKGGLRKEVESVLLGNGLDLKSTEKFFFYAYVDPRNKRSALLCEEFGFEPIRQYTTVIFSRINLKNNSENTIIEVSFDESVEELLRDFYRDYNTVSFENLSGKKYYFILNERGERVAGMHVHPDRWKIYSLPGLTGKLILNVFAHIPVVKRLFGRNYNFLTVEGVYVVPGFEKYLEKLLESLLAKYQINSAICLVDTNTGLYNTLKSLRLGLMDKLNKEVSGTVLCKFVNFSREEKDNFHANPVYLSGTDAT